MRVINIEVPSIETEKEIVKLVEDKFPGCEIKTDPIEEVEKIKFNFKDLEVILKEKSSINLWAEEMKLLEDPKFPGFVYSIVLSGEGKILGLRTNGSNIELEKTFTGETLDRVSNHIINRL